MGGDDKQNEAVGDRKGRDGERLREKKEMKKKNMTTPVFENGLEI